MRYDLEFMPSLAGSDSEMVARADGDWVLHVSHLAEVHQTQRRMIAALYWRAGATMVLAERAEKAGNGPRAERLINDGAGTWNAARAMEAACAR